MSTAFVISPLPKICTSRGPRSVVRHGSETNLRKRARAHCTKIRRVMLCHITNPGEDSGDSDDTPTVPGDWREFRAALVAGSAEKLERSKETAYRKGHWAHSVRHHWLLSQAGYVFSHYERSLTYKK